MAEERHECNFYNIIGRTVKPAIDSSCYTHKSDKVVFLWGDSHAQHLNHGLKKSQPTDVSTTTCGNRYSPPTGS